MTDLYTKIAAIDARSNQAEYDRVDALIDAHEAQPVDSAPVDMTTLTGGRDAAVYRLVA